MRRLIFLFLVAAACHAESMAQGTSKATLETQISHIEDGVPRLSLLLRLADTYQQTMPAEAVHWSQEARVLAQKLGDKVREDTAWNTLGRANLQLGNNTAALKAFYSELKLAEEQGDRRSIARSHGNIGLVYGILGDFDTALQHQQTALRLFRSLAATPDAMQRANAVSTALSLADVGQLYKEMARFDTAQHYYNEALDSYRNLGEPRGIATCLGGIANICYNTGDQVQAIRIQRRALVINDSLGDLISAARSVGNIGSYYLKISQDSLPARFATPGLVPVGAHANLLLAIDYFNRAYTQSVAAHDGEGQTYFAQQLATAYEMAGKPSEALRFFKEYTAANDSVVSVNAKTSVAQIESERVQMLKEKQIELDRLAVEKKRNERGFFAAGIVLLLAIVFFIARERKRSERLLLNILPAKIATRLKSREHPIADQFTEASIMFIDMAGFTHYCAGREPKVIVTTLNEVFTRIDTLAEQFGLEKIKTIGDAYMAVAGLPEPQADHARRAAGMALAVQREMADYCTADGANITFRIGLDCGPVVAGVIGRKKFTYDLWGDAVNTASRMETTGIAGAVHCSDTFRKAAADGPFRFVSRGIMDVKGKGAMETWFIEGE